MIRRSLAFALAAVFVALAFEASPAQDEKPKQKRQGGFGAPTTLLPDDAVEKLGLTGDAKDKFAKLLKEYEEKFKTSTDKVKEAMQKARQDMDFSKLREQMQEVREAGTKLREELQTKAKALLNDDQTKKLEELVKTASARRPGGNTPRPGGNNTRPNTQAPAGDGQLLPSSLRDKLELTAEQKAKLEKLQKESEAKLKEILTDEQKKKLDELKKGDSTARPRRPNREL